MFRRLLFFFVIFYIFPGMLQAQPGISVTTGHSPAAVVQQLFANGNCMQISNITFSGNAAAFGRFSNGTSSIGLSSGIVLASSDVNFVEGPNTTVSANIGFSTDSPNDPDLATLTQINQYDVAVLEFDFVPVGNAISFDFVFGSEEYCEFVGSNYNDVFGFFLSGPGITGSQNLAVVPFSATPISINTVNHQTNTAYYINNSASALQCAGIPPFNLIDCQLDGWTTVLQASAVVTPCQQYHLKIAIADVGDQARASAVFLGANSFQSGLQLAVEPVYPAGQQGVIEGCQNGAFRFRRSGGNISQPLTINYSVTGGSAVAGLDYFPLPGVLIFPPGVGEMLIPVTTLADAFPEGPETVNITFNSGCNCQQQTVELNILDSPPLAVQGDSLRVCLGESVILTPGATGGTLPLVYSWNTGAVTPQLQVVPNQNTGYQVVVTDACGQRDTAHFAVEIPPVASAVLSGGGVFCGDTLVPVALNLAFAGNGPWLVEYLQNGVPDTATFVTNPAQLLVTGPASISLASVTGAEGCPGMVSGSANIPYFDLSAALTVATPACAGSTDGSVTAQVNGGGGPYTYSWSVPGQTAPVLQNIPAGMYSLTVSNTFGCTTSVQTTVSEPLPLGLSAILPDTLTCKKVLVNLNAIASGGTAPYSYTWSPGASNSALAVNQPGLYRVTVTDANGCTENAEVTIEQDTATPVAIIAHPPVLTCSAPVIHLSAENAAGGANVSASWSGPGVISGGDGFGPAVNQSGIYQLLLRDSLNGCSDSAAVFVMADTAKPAAAIAAVAPLTCTRLFTRLSAKGSLPENKLYFNWAGPVGQSGTDTVLIANLPGWYYLMVQDTVNGCTDSTSVLVYQDITPPQAIAKATDTLTCDKLQVLLDGTESSTGSQFEYLWTTQMGNIISGEQSLSPVAGLPGVYRLTVRNTENGCFDSAEVAIVQDTVAPHAAAAFPDTLNCNITAVEISATGSSTGNRFEYTWSTAYGILLSSGENFAVLAGGPGVYQLKVRDIYNGCTDSTSVWVVQDTATPHVVLPEIIAATCTSPLVSITPEQPDSSGYYIFHWSANAGPGVIVNADSAFTAWVDGPGIFSLQVTDVNNGCTGMAVTTVTAPHPVPVASIEEPLPLTCERTEVILKSTGAVVPGFAITWFGPGISGPANQPEVTVTLPGEYILIVTNPDNGCTAQATAIVSQDTVAPVAVASAAPSPGCDIIETEVSGEGSSTGPAFHYEWSSTEGEITGETDRITAQVAGSGMYFLQVTNQLNGCTAADSVLVIPGPEGPASVQWTALWPNCDTSAGTLVILSVEGGLPPYVFTVDGDQLPGTSTVLNLEGPGIYQLEVEDVNGCRLVQPISVPPPQLPGIFLPAELTLEFGAAGVVSAQLNVPLSALQSVVWQPEGRFQPGPSPEQIIVQPEEDTYYTLTITDKNGCTAQADIWVRVGELGIYVPNIIATGNPENPDNGWFTIFASKEGVKEIKQLSVFDRWGNAVFSREHFLPNRPALGWNGQISGRTGNSGVYVWWAEIELINGDVIFLKGDVTLKD